MTHPQRTTHTNTLRDNEMLTEYDAVETLRFNSSCMWDASTFGSEYLLMMILLVVMPLEHLVFYACYVRYQPLGVIIRTINCYEAVVSIGPITNTIFVLNRIFYCLGSKY